MTWVGVGEQPCVVCGASSSFHVTVKVELAGESTTRMKVVQFWLCKNCETANQQIFAQDDARQKRIALRLTDHPSFMSRWRDWRGKKYWSPEELERQAVFDQEWDNQALRERARQNTRKFLTALQKRQQG